MSDSTHVFRQFSQFLQSLEDGQFHQECSDILNEINTVLTEYQLNHGNSTKPKASITIRIDFASDKADMLTITPHLDKKLPKEPRGQAVMYRTPKGLTPLNPKQIEMFNGQPKAVADNKDVKAI